MESNKSFILCYWLSDFTPGQMGLAQSLLTSPSTRQTTG